jgi:tight adherence protein C
MNPLLVVQLLVFVGAACCAGVLSLLFRACLRKPALPVRDAPWPWFIRAALGPARALAPWVNALISESRLTAVRMRLEAADLYPGVTAVDWVALRVVHCLVATVIAIMALAATRSLSFGVICLCALGGYLAAGSWLRKLNAESRRQIIRDLPSYLDLLTVCVEAGATLTAAVRMIIEQAPPSPLRKYFERVLREVRGGRTRSQAFMGVASSYGVESLSTLASALAHAEAAGMSIGSVLRSQSEQRNAERFMRAEKLAMEAPVKMLGPLIFCIFPCTFIVLAVPIAHKLLEVLHS